MRELSRLGDEMQHLREILYDFHTAAMPQLREVLEHVRKQEPSTGKLLTKKGAAEYLGVCEKTVHRLVQEGQLRYLRIGSRMMFKKTELANYVERRNKPYSTRRPNGRRRRSAGSPLAGRPDASPAKLASESDCSSV